MSGQRAGARAHEQQSIVLESIGTSASTTEATSAGPSGTKIFRKASGRGAAHTTRLPELARDSGRGRRQRAQREGGVLGDVGEHQHPEGVGERARVENHRDNAITVPGSVADIPGPMSARDAKPGRPAPYAMTTPSSVAASDADTAMARLFFTARVTVAQNT